MILNGAPIDITYLGEHLLLTAVSAIFEYQNGKKTDNITGHRYTIVLPKLGFDKINVKIEGKRQLDPPEGYAEVAFDGLEVHAYWTPNGYQVAASAKGIRLVGDGKGVKV